jgi:glycosyltransferase involved in cell wall biosynthesis
MKIGIDFHSAERDGTGNSTYIRNLVESLLKIDLENEYFLYVTDLNYRYYVKFKKVNNVHLRLINSKNPFVRIPLLGIRTLIDKIDVLHVQYIAPPIHSGKLVVTIHDISFLHFPECFRKFERFRQRLLIPINIKKADKILTVSKFSQEDIVKNYNIPISKVQVTYCGVNPIFKPLENPQKYNNMLRQFGIFSKFLLYVGRIDVRKNISALIKAFLLLKQTKKIPHQLVIVGQKDFLPKHIREDIELSKYRKDIIFTGYVPENYLLVFYNLADVFVYPSLFEGFGLPCLEAMACGCPVVTSNVSSLPEVVGEAGLCVNTSNIKELSEAIFNLISNPKLREELRNKGLKRAKLFNWDKTAQETLEIYKEISLEDSYCRF